MKRIVLILFGGALVLGACQSASEVLVEQIAEQVEGVDNVEIDTETGQINIETEEGSISIGAGEIPDGFPVPFADGGEVISSIVIGDQAGVTTVYAADRYDELVTFYEDWTAQYPGEWTTFNSTNASSGQTLRNSSWILEGAVETTFIIGVQDCIGASVSAFEGEAVCVNVNMQGSTG